MFIKKKLKDISKEEYKEFVRQKCKGKCKECLFRDVHCGYIALNWIDNKKIYNDTFLNQEIEIETPDILDKEEKEYLRAVIKPFRNRVSYIIKFTTAYDDLEYICIYLKNMQGFSLPSFKKYTMYKGMKVNKAYILKELDL